MIEHIDAPTLSAWLADADRAPPLVLDVREPWETDLGTIPGSVCLPMGRIPQTFHDLDPARDWVVVCHHGARSLQVARFLDAQGFARLHNLDGGIDAWSRLVDPGVRRY
ncbi:MAG: rhodanese-like domain-containing protein [Burkholderiales bacterium]|jgi:rhodanese-related sulfurtransferase|nr:rhodanese-like domain-containing protein [Burkholderiales bacterium]